MINSQNVQGKYILLSLVYRWISKQLLKFINLDSVIIPECFARKSRFSLLKNLFSLALDSSILPVYLCPSLSLPIPSLLLFSVSRPISQSFSFCFLILNKYERYLYFQADTLLDTLFSIFFSINIPFPASSIFSN